jgi:SPP1 gp7 family putative phage head morphogenesis protein
MQRQLVAPTRRPVILAPIHPNAGLTAAYNRKLVSLIDEMARSLARWIPAKYRANPPLAQDDILPSRGLTEEMEQLGDRWLKRFDDAAPVLAKWFATAAKDRADASLAATLRQAGFTVKFQMSPAVSDVFAATLAEQTRLIKTIPAESLARVAGIVNRSVQTGGDVGGLARDLQDAFGIDKRRAQFIARSQNSIATATITRARQTELGIADARWLHSGGGRHARPSHVAASGKPYDVAKGMYIDGEWIYPGVLPNCRCVSISVVPGLE